MPVRVIDPKGAAKFVHPGRGFGVGPPPKKAPKLDADAAWAAIHTRAMYVVQWQHGFRVPDELKDATTQILAEFRSATAPVPGSAEHEALRWRIAHIVLPPVKVLKGESTTSALVQWWLATVGTIRTVEIVLAALRLRAGCAGQFERASTGARSWQVQGLRVRPVPAEAWFELPDTRRTAFDGSPMGEALPDVRAWLVTVPEAEYTAARDRASALRADASWIERLLIAYLFPAEEEWCADAVREALIPRPETKDDGGWPVQGTATGAKEMLPHIAVDVPDFQFEPKHACGFLGREGAGDRIVAAFTAGASGATWFLAGTFLDGPGVAPLVASALIHYRFVNSVTVGKKEEARVHDWLLARPAEALAVLTSPPQQALRDRILRENPALSDVPVLPESEWPAPLREPTGELPKGWASSAYGDLRLVDGRTLPMPAVDRLGGLLRDAPAHTARLDALRPALDPASAETWMSAVLRAYTNPLGAEGHFVYPAALAFLGEAFLPEWARRVEVTWSWGNAVGAGHMLQALATIGSTAALRTLNTLALKAKNAKLRRQAEGTLASAAAARRMTADQLADTLVPSLGLDKTGACAFAHNKRTFTARIGENLSLAAFDGAGVRVDERVVEGADRWKELKRELKSVAVNEILRLERSMIVGREWSGAELRSVVIASPILRQLARRLVWVTADGSSSFRVDESGGLVNVADEPFVLADDARVRVAHPLDLGDTTEWRRVFADYALVQPFPQLERETFGAGDAPGIVARLTGSAVHEGLLRGLADGGWSRGSVDGNGLYHETVYRSAGIDAVIEHAPLSAEHFEPTTRTIRAVRVSGGSGRELSEVLRGLAKLG